MTTPQAAIYLLDTGPLITLAAADCLDYLLYPNVPVVIPDAVSYEATRDSAKLGAQSIMDWVKAHHTQVEIAVTNAYVNFDAARLANPGTYEPNLGERAAVEVIEEPARPSRRRQGDPAVRGNRCHPARDRAGAREDRRTRHHGFSQAAGGRAAHPVGRRCFRPCACRRAHAVTGRKVWRSRPVRAGSGTRDVALRATRPDAEAINRRRE